MARFSRRFRESRRLGHLLPPSYGVLFYFFSFFLPFIPTPTARPRRSPDTLNLFHGLATSATDYQEPLSSISRCAAAPVPLSIQLRVLRELVLQVNGATSLQRLTTTPMANDGLQATLQLGTVTLQLIFGKTGLSQEVLKNPELDVRGHTLMNHGRAD